MFPVVLPAVRKIKEVESLVNSAFSTFVLLGGHLGQIKPIVDLARARGKGVILHADLIDGLKNDEYAAEFLCQTVRPLGLISTRTSVIQRTKMNKVLAIQRLFLLDSDALERSYALIEKTRPDYIEVMPGVIPELIQEVKARTGVPVIAGGLIRSAEQVDAALTAGAAAVTTSRRELWKLG
ncbi:glycerol-3-phosphate responsive antiterminator [Paenibacillus sacheonensis]|uniref:Glycerol uptake operon antiterminator regulatory protein n=1 Tax=Paenibacillus sacheonensis TaxID=742054 RepID=A0A7X5C0K8_9BACL|nr:glycerol-3-phosphate responsive antiterminator [Paenibacillus sacheonensis]MBM7568161.1 glycerol uptake operon antiterminator [Paenibacillus sacheonensis]NBC71837.1 glycerol-3-phosphate responsive antiterminator GlpP [Paenibacillus sacheonensis]